MVENRAVERVRRRRQAPGGSLVAVARPRIAARVVMGEDEPLAAVLTDVDYDVAQREVGAGLVARISSEVDAAGLTVDMRHPQGLAARVGLREAAREEGSGRGKPVEFEREFGTLIPHR